MTNKEVIKMLTAKAECMRRETSGTDFDCNFRNCYKCDLNYEQGTIGDQIEALSVVISALRAQDVPDTNVGDMVSRRKAIDALCKRCDLVNDDTCGEKCIDIKILEKLPSAQPEWNNHTVACLLAELFDDPCACNYNGIDEWLPEKCEVIDTCPNPVGVACWEQYLKHRAERRTNERTD